MRRIAAVVLAAGMLLTGCGGSSEDRTAGCDAAEDYLRALMAISDLPSNVDTQTGLDALAARNRALNEVAKVAPNDVRDAAEIMLNDDSQSLSIEDQQKADTANSTITDWIVADCKLAPPN